jgi:RIMS-binding protein 2
MVAEVSEGAAGTQGVAGTSGVQSMRTLSRDRWGDIYANMPVKRMVALYDYDPQELSPNVDAEVRFSTKENIFQTR